MKNIILLLIASFITISLSAQKLSKEERLARDKAIYEEALSSINAKAFVIIPTSYTSTSGNNEIEENTDLSNFLLFEGNNVITQGKIISDINEIIKGEIVDYSEKVDKKGNVRLSVKVNGRLLKGNFTINLRVNSDVVDVIFVPQNGSTRKFTGPVQAKSKSNFIKRGNPI